MFKRWRCYVALLLCLCCTFATLSLNTLQVNAQVSVTSISSTSSLSFNYDLGQTKFPLVQGTVTSGYVNNGTGSTSSGSINSTAISNYMGDYYHFKIPLNIHGDISGSPVTTDYIAYVLYLSSFNLTVNDGSIYNVSLTDSNGKLICVGVGGSGGLITNFGQVSDIWSTNGQATYNYYLEFDINFDSSVASRRTVSGTVGTVLYIQPSSASEVPTIKVSDIEASQHLTDINTNAEQTNRNSAGILSSITSFFGSFFDNIINSLKSLFIPEDGYFTTWFTRLNTLLSAKLGMLYAPFDLVISVLTALSSASTSEAGIPFPELAWDGQVIIPAQTFYFSSLGSSFSDLRDAVYFGTDVVLLFAFLVLLQRKINLVMRGNEEG